MVIGSGKGAKVLVFIMLGMAKNEQVHGVSDVPAFRDCCQALLSKPRNVELLNERTFHCVELLHLMFETWLMRVVRTLSVIQMRCCYGDPE